MGKLGLGRRAPIYRFIDRGIETRYTMPGWTTGNALGFAQAADTIYHTPILLREIRTFDRIGIEMLNAGVGGDLARLGLYSSSLSSSGLKSDVLLLDAGTVDISTTGEKLITISITLAPGYYFLAYVAHGVGNPRGMSRAATAAAPITGAGVSPGDRLDNIVHASAANPGADWPANGLPDPAEAVFSVVNPIGATVRLRDSS